MNKIKGIALVAVLAVLVVLAILSATFAALMSIERRSANTNVAKVQSDLCAEAGLQHALSVLRTDYFQQPAWDDFTEIWRTSFTPSSKNIKNSVDIDGLKDKLNDGRWIYVKDSNGMVVGRYAVLIEDENSKINVNAAAALSTKMQNQGVGTFEIMLSDGKNLGLPLSQKAAQKIMNFKYGKDRKPGQANVDDNLTESEYQSDEIDNDADGLIDEADEGIDEPQEYNPLSPKWDDKAYSSIHELTDSLSGNYKNKLTLYRYLKKYATVRTHGRDIYWDERDKTWRNQVNLNTATKRQVQKIIKRANDISRFEPSSKNLRSLTANIIDYHDENNVLSTLGSEYGVEAICFNEVMANDGSYSLEAEGFQPTSNFDKYNYVHRFGIWYNVEDTSWKYGWPMKKVGHSGGAGATVLTNGVLAKIPHTTTVELKSDMVRAMHNFKYRDFKKIVNSMGGVPNDLWKNGWLKVYQGKNAKPDYIYYPIIGNKGNILTVGYDDNQIYIGKAEELETIKQLAEQGVDLSANDEYLLNLAIENNKLDVVKYLIEQGADVHMMDEYPIYWASLLGHLEIVKCLIENGVDIHVREEYALQMACENGHLEMVKWLVENGADIHCDDDYVLMLATDAEQYEVVKYLCEQGANIHVDNNYIVECAKNKADKKIYNYFISLG